MLCNCLYRACVVWKQADRFAEQEILFADIADQTLTFSIEN